MRERITYVIRDSARQEFSPKQLTVSTNNFAVDGLDAIKEHSITYEAKQIAPEIWRVLRNVHELHVRWSTAQPYTTFPPYTSRVVPGLHISFTPLEGRSAKRLCALIKESFGQRIKCESVEAAFSTPSILSERFATSAARQFYAFQPSLQDLSIFIQRKLCGEDAIPCRLRAHDLEKAQSLDIDFDAVSQSLVVKALWTRANGDDDKWYETHLKGDKAEDTLEVGVLMNEKPIEDEEVRFSGFLTKIGEDKKPSPTLFSTPARHHPLPGANSIWHKAAFKTPTGLHPVLGLQFTSVPTSPSEGCALHAYFTLPSTLFFDKYAFSDELALKSHSLRALHAISGETDLEAPEWAIKRWGSAALFEIAVPEDTTGRFEVTFPMHLRYLEPFNASSILLPVPWPNVFWSCPAEKGSKYATSPFDRVNLGYDGLFGSNTVFYHVPPAPHVSRNVETLNVPVLDLTKTSRVEIGTVAVILAGTFWVLWALARGVWRDGYGASTLPRKKVE